MTISIFIAFAYQMIAAAMVSGIVKEKYKKVKMQLLMSGSSVTAYWLGHYIVDVAIHLLVQGASLLYIHIFNIELPSVWVIFLLFVVTNPLFLYCWSHLFEKEGPAGTSVRMLFIFVGGAFGIAAIILQFFESTRTVGLIIRYIFCILPIFSLVYGILAIVYR